jgi:hypothetical protein
MLARVGMLAGLILLMLAGGAAAEDRYVDVIDPSVHYQTIDHFTASDCWTIQKIGEWSDENRTKVADLLFSRDKGIGLSAWRCNLGGGLENRRIGSSWRRADTYEISQGKYDWTRCPGQRWFLAAAKARGVNEFIAFCNSPPERLTRNGLTCTDNDPAITNNLKPGMEHQFGRYLADIVTHFRDNPNAAERINFQWVSPINEPQWEWVGGQEGSRADNDEIRRQYKAVYAELQRQHLPTHILGPESGSIPDMSHLAGASRKYHAAYGDYIDTLCRDPMLASAMNHTIGYHSYWSDSPNQIIENRKKLRQKLDQFPQWRAFETEYCVMEPGRDLSMITAIRAIRIVHADLTIVNASAWAWWLAISNGDYKDGLLYTDWHHPGDDENVIPSKLFWAYGNFTRFVRPGMVRIALHDTAARHDINGLMGCAFRDPRNSRLIVVYINAADQPATVDLKTSGGSRVKWTPFITSDKPGDDLREYPALPARAPVIVPPMAVVTLVGQS